AVPFEATRDTTPERWSPLGPDGKVRKFDDLPAQYQRNINYEPPFDRQPGQPPALSDQDVSDIVAFLRTLTDGFEPPTPGRVPDSGGHTGQTVADETREWPSTNECAKADGSQPADTHQGQRPLRRDKSPDV